MKIYLKSGDKEFSFEAIESVMKDEETVNFIFKLYREMFTDGATSMPVDASKLFKGDSETFAEHYGCKPAQSPERDALTFRKRLPNNVVDISKLTVQEAVTEHALVRCPKCGQSHAIVLRDNGKLYLMRRSYATDEFGIVMDVDDTTEGILKICCEEETPERKLKYFYDIQALGFKDDKDFAVNNDTDVFCPVCGQSSPFIHWKEARDRKHMYFEHEYICGACGGECLMDAQEEKDGRETVVCTQCGKKWLKEQTE